MGNMAMMDTSPYETFNMFIKMASMSTSKRIATRIGGIGPKMVPTLR